jgi:hypothetical protein
MIPQVCYDENFCAITNVGSGSSMEIQVEHFAKSLKTRHIRYVFLLGEFIKRF